MSRDLYVSMAGASAAWTQIEVVANNLANASTAGFKQQRVAFDLQAAMADPLGEVYVGTEPVSPDFSDGALMHDQVDTHLALRGRGFFLAGSGAGQTLVRAGTFRLDSEGYLVTQAGQQVQGQSGPIQLEPGQKLQVGADGTLLDQDGAEIDRLRIVDGTALTALGGTSWRAQGPVFEVEGVAVVQGALEASNTDPMRSMTELMEASRYFEAYQKAMQTSDSLDGQLNQMIGG
ncbi:MAG: flagellar hook basal-body protein [Pseudomonadota bacterium]